MTKPVAVQLYSVREALKADFEGTIRRIASMGFAGVEFARDYGGSAVDAAALCDELGLQRPSAHMAVPIGDESDDIFADARALGLTTIVCPWLPAQRFETLDSIQAVCAELTTAAEAAKAAGFRYAYHNHDFEFKPLADGSLPYDHMRRLLPPDMLFEVDIYWVKYAGHDPAALLADLGDRAPLVHVKDGSGEPGSIMLAAGEGIVDIPAAVTAATSAEWLVVELDNCATDMFEAVDKSLRYLTTQGLGHGR